MICAASDPRVRDAAARAADDVLFIVARTEKGGGPGTVDSSPVPVVISISEGFDEYLFGITR